MYSWLLESEAANTSSSYVERTLSTSVPVMNHNQSVAYDLLNDALKIVLKKCSTEVPIDVKPYRLLTSLFDKPQIGPVILDSILFDVFRTLYLSCLNQQKHKNSTIRCVSFNGDLTSLKTDESVLNKQFISKHCQEIVKNANLLFNTLQSYYIWSYIEKLFIDSIKDINSYKYRDRCQVNEIGSGLPHILEICILTDFLLDIIPIESTESTSSILPNLFTQIISSLRTYITEVNQHEISESLELCTRILSKIQPTSLSDYQKIENDQDEKVSLNDTTEKTLANSTIGEGKNDGGEQRILEKSKSDSKINENLNSLDKQELTVDESSRERSYSNQMVKKKDKNSPKVEKKPKNKKSKSSSKLYDMKNDDISESLSLENISQDKQEVGDQSETVIQVGATFENKFFLKCLEEYKKFYMVFIKSKILPHVDTSLFIKSLTIDKNERLNNLIQMLEARLHINETSEFTAVIVANTLKNPSLSLSNVAAESAASEFENPMSKASNLLLEFSAFPNLPGNSNENHLPPWLESLIVAGCCKDSSRYIQITAMNTLLEIFSLANNQVPCKREESNTNIVITGILDMVHVHYLEEKTIIIEVSMNFFYSFLKMHLLRGLLFFFCYLGGLVGIFRDSSITFH